MFSKTHRGIQLLAGTLMSLCLTTPARSLEIEYWRSVPLGENVHPAGLPVKVAQDSDSFQQAEELYNNGTNLQEQGDLETAIAQYREAIRLNPNFAEAYVNLGVALVKVGQMEEGIAAYHKALDIDPDLAAAHYNLGNAFGEQQQLTEAIAAYEQAIRIDPNYTKAYYNLGNAYVNLGELPLAISSYREAIRLDPSFAEAHGNLGIVLYQQGQKEEAAQYLKNAWELFQTQGNTEAAIRVQNVLRQIADSSN